MAPRRQKSAPNKQLSFEVPSPAYKEPPDLSSPRHVGVGLIEEPPAAETADEPHPPTERKPVEHGRGRMSVRGRHGDELESLRFEKDAAVQQAIQRSADEIQQLKSTTGSLRDELESAQYELEEEVQKTRLRNQNEIQHLKQTVEKLRHELEAKHAQ